MKSGQQSSWERAMEGLKGGPGYEDPPLYPCPTCRYETDEEGKPCCDCAEEGSRDGEAI